MIPHKSKQQLQRLHFGPWGMVGGVLLLLLSLQSTLAFSASSSLSSSKPLLALLSMAASSATAGNSDAGDAKADSPKKVLVTGANGYLASHIVKELLSLGHSVNACVRNANSESSMAHLKALPGAADRLRLFSTGNLEDANDETRPFDKPMEQCHAVFHAATPLSSSSSGNGETEIFEPAMTSTRELLSCIARNSDTVKCLVLTSSMSAVAPRPEPSIKDESHWSDSEAQKSRQNWYGATKTCQEQMVRKWVQKAKDDGIISKEDFVYSAICPTVIIGPSLQVRKDPQNIGGTMGRLRSWLLGDLTEVPNDSMSFIHVEDCARMHARILSLSPADINSHQRYMNVIESLHWNDIIKMFKEFYPSLPEYKEVQENGNNLAKPTQFNLDNMKSLGIPYRNTRETLAQSIGHLKETKALNWYEQT